MRVLFFLLMLAAPLKGGEVDHMVLIPAGEFQMGTPAGKGEQAERPQHKVFLDAYYLDAYEVTMADFTGFLNKVAADEDIKQYVRFPSYWLSKTEEGIVLNPTISGSEAAFDVTWYGADRYCRERGAFLPTEAEWERACRADSEEEYPSAGGIKSIGDYAWYGANSLGGAMQPIGQKKPNAWGIFDMAGNVKEWVSDWYTKDYYHKSPAKNPVNDFASGKKVLRGGSRLDKPFELRCATRRSIVPTSVALNVGFRCAKSLEAK